VIIQQIAALTVEVQNLQTSYSSLQTSYSSVTNYVNNYVSNYVTNYYESVSNQYVVVSRTSDACGANGGNMPYQTRNIGWFDQIQRDCPHYPSYSYDNAGGSSSPSSYSSPSVNYNSNTGVFNISRPGTYDLEAAFEGDFNSMYGSSSDTVEYAWLNNGAPLQPTPSCAALGDDGVSHRSHLSHRISVTPTQVPYYVQVGLLPGASSSFNQFGTGWARVALVSTPY